MKSYLTKRLDVRTNIIGTHVLQTGRRIVHFSVKLSLVSLGCKKIVAQILNHHMIVVAKI